MSHLLKCWGRDENKLAELAPPDWRDGDRTCHYWRSPAELSRIKKIAGRLCVVQMEAKGPDADIFKTAVVRLAYRGRLYTIHHEVGYGFEDHSIHYMFEEGNYSCDCNRSLFIAQECDDYFPHMDCGESIELVSLQIEKKQRPGT